ncbi:MAG: TlyA family RNA methyltransferase [Ruminococcaceae bacterium]|nr:TlyA family RNA methyltransferase [Oscillospiraceae bacterium]
MGEKIRADLLLCKLNLAESREKAKNMIQSGVVFLGSEKISKPSLLLNESDLPEIRGETLKYVSRGGLKLEKAINLFKIDLQNKVCMDIGASTGGFTDCMLQNGAKKVYAVDVGTNQLHEKLKSDARVVNLEKTNARNITKEAVPEGIDFISCDVSFISLKIILPVIKELLSGYSEAMCLIKPQFEAGKQNIGKNGVVKDKSVHCSVLKDICDFALSLGLSISGLSYSPIKGPEGNIEYLIYLKKNDILTVSDINIKDIVEKSHKEL